MAREGILFFRRQQAHGLSSKFSTLILLTLVLTSCASSPMALSDTKALPQGETIVFGRVKVISEGKTMSWGVLKRPSSIEVLSERGPEPDPYLLEGDGTFLWHLPPGGYTITEFATFVGLGGYEIRPVFAYFVVPEGTPLVYIGTLKITLETERDLVSIDDEYQHALLELKNKFTEIKADATKSLMHLEKAR